MIEAASVARRESLCCTEAVAAGVAREGFAVVDDVVPVELVESLRCAIDQVNETPSVRTRRGRAFAIRNAFEVLPAARAIAGLDSIVALARCCLPASPRVTRAIIFDKNPQANWAVAWHQDTTIAVLERIDQPGFGPWSVKAGVVHVQPPASVLARLITLRVQIDDCDEGNGPLLVVPRSNLHGILTDEEIARRREVGPIAACTGRSGSVVIMRPLLLHASKAADAPRRRLILHLEFAGEDLPPPLRWREG